MLERIVWLSYQSGNSSRVEENYALSAAKLYSRVWKEEPWNECFWTPENSLEEILSFQTKDSGILIIGSIDGLVVGFTSGWMISGEEFNRRLGINYSDSSERYFYISEMGVDSSFRGIGLGKELLGRIILQVKAQNKFDSLVLRTDKKAIPAKRLYQNAGFLDLGIAGPDYPTRNYWLKR